ncbi:hypothetical protein [Patulibacter defluvii]|uniref:hypothetical protein n=1 Tax=Patulibacter defluvii TaxID=3095358 RepID=UPI002A74C595|nr:hypothetical protein [Patulibacter sp. DM4]
MSTEPRSYDDPFVPRTAGPAWDALRVVRRPTVRPAADGLCLRPATAADGEALRTIAERDSAQVPAGPLVLAEAAGTPLAAISLATGEVIADPFWPTAGAVVALRDFAHGRPRRRRWWRGRG